MEFPRKYWRNLDWPLIAAVLILTVLGLIVIYSASSSRLAAAGDDPLHFVKRQLLFFIVGLIGLGLTISFDYRILGRWVRFLYTANIGLLTAVLFFGRTVFGSQRWFRIGPFNLQPSELAKIVLIVVLAKYLEGQEDLQGTRLLVPIFLVALPMVLIIMQPDMGTSIIFVGILFSLLYLAGARTKHLAIMAGTGIAGIAGAFFVSLQGWLPIMKPYQVTRLLVFLDPYADRTRSGWNIIQSMTAIGSGGFLGKGILSGTQSQLNFLPANHTDFVFSVVAEELGFVGGLSVLVLFAVIIWRGLFIAAYAKDTFGRLIASGCVGLFFFHVLVNVGMSLGVMPVTGLPLPFISYGGSTLLASLLAVGLLLNVGLRRKKIMF